VLWFGFAEAALTRAAVRGFEVPVRSPFGTIDGANRFFACSIPSNFSASFFIDSSSTACWRRSLMDVSVNSSLRDSLSPDAGDSDVSGSEAGTGAGTAIGAEISEETSSGVDSKERESDLSPLGVEGADKSRVTESETDFCGGRQRDCFLVRGDGSVLGPEPGEGEEEEHEGEERELSDEKLEGRGGGRGGGVDVPGSGFVFGEEMRREPDDE